MVDNAEVSGTDGTRKRTVLILCLVLVGLAVPAYNSSYACLSYVDSLLPIAPLCSCPFRCATCQCAVHNCGAGRYFSSTAFSAGDACVACDRLTCDAGTNRIGTCGTEVDDNQYSCNPCPVCNKGSFRDVGCDGSASEPTPCETCSTCEEGTYEFAPCTPTSDTVCNKCRNNKCM